MKRIDKRRVYLHRVPIGFLVPTFDQELPSVIRLAIYEALIAHLQITPHGGSWSHRDGKIDWKGRNPHGFATTDEYQKWRMKNELTRGQAQDFAKDGRDLDFMIIIRKEMPEPRPTKTTKVLWDLPGKPEHPEDTRVSGVVEEYPGYLGALRYAKEEFEQQLRDETNSGIGDLAYTIKVKGGKPSREYPTPKAQVLDELIAAVDEKIQKEIRFQRRQKRKLRRRWKV